MEANRQHIHNEVGDQRERFLLALARAERLKPQQKLELALAYGAGGEPASAAGVPALDSEQLRADIEALAKSGARLVGAGDAEMPLRLRSIVDAPAALFVRGETAALSRPQIAIIGSRRATPAGAGIARRFAAELADLGFVITSGLARGIDAQAHQGALDAGGRTIAVLGSSLDHIYPAGHRRLAERVVANGALVSEFPFGTAPLPWHFPWRNRIISGLSLGVLVIEAAERSGSLITARLAADQGREVFAVPGSILNPSAKGCHRLIRDGAKLVERVEDVLEELPPEELAKLESAPDARDETGVAEGAASSEAAVPEAQARLLEHLGFEPVSADALAERAGLTPAEIYPILLRLELAGAIEKDGAGRYVRVG